MVEYTISHFQAILEILFVISILFILSKVSLNITLISFSVLFILISLTVLLTKNSLKKIAEKRQYYEKKNYSSNSKHFYKFYINKIVK